MATAFSSVFSVEPSPSGSSSLTVCLTGTWWKVILPFPGPELPSKSAAPATWGHLGTWSRHSRPACHILHVGDVGRVPDTRGWWPLPGTGPQGSLWALSAADEGCGAGQDRGHIAAPALAVRSALCVCPLAGRPPPGLALQPTFLPADHAWQTVRFLGTLLCFQPLSSVLKGSSCKPAA